MNKELNMFNRKKNKLFKISTLKNKLTDVQTTLIAFDFELMEIWTPDEGDEKQVWFNQSKNKTIEVTIASDEDANRNDVVTELIDIWIELKELKDGILTFLNDENDFIETKSKSPLDEFNRQVQLTKEEWENNEVEFNFIYNKKLDPTVLTYLRLSEEDKLKVTH